MSDRYKNWIEQQDCAANYTPREILVTLFGDVVSTHGEVVCQTSLVAMGKALGFADGSIRTAVFRLSSDGLIESQQVGRRSDYRISADMGVLATESIYRAFLPPTDSWNGDWEWVSLHVDDLVRTHQSRLAADLMNEGFCRVSNTTFVRPVLPEYLSTRSVFGPSFSDHAIRFVGQMDDRTSLKTAPTVLASLFSLPSLAECYRGFIHDCEPVLQAIVEDQPITAEQAFVIRTVMIHRWRKLVGRDPLLPACYLPKDWPYSAAYFLAKSVYDGLIGRSEEYLATVLETANGHPIPLQRKIYERFGGLTAIS